MSLVLPNANVLALNARPKLIKVDEDGSFGPASDNGPHTVASSISYPNAKANRTLIIMINVADNDDPVISSLTLGGDSFTLTELTDAGGANYYVGTMSNSNDTSGDLVVTFSNMTGKSFAFVNWCLWEVFGLKSNTPLSTGLEYDATSIMTASSVVIPGNAIVLAHSYGHNTTSSSSTCTFTGLTGYGVYVSYASFPDYRTTWAYRINDPAESGEDLSAEWSTGGASGAFFHAVFR